MRAHITASNRIPVTFKDGKAPMPGRLYYLAHPFGTHKGKNTTEAERARNQASAANIERQLLRMGIQVINPLLLPLGRVLCPAGELEIDENLAFEQCLQLLTPCCGIIMSPGWENSTGCGRERLKAEGDRKDVFEIAACI